MTKSVRPRTGHLPAAKPVALAIGREEFDQLVQKLNDAECLVGTVEAAIRQDLAHEGSTLRQALRAIEDVASELDAALPKRAPAAA